MSEEFLKSEDRTQAIFDAEAASRRAESEASVLRALHRGESKSDALIAAEKSEADARTRLDELHSSGRPADLSGISRGLSDSAGNFAPNVEVMTAGGIGVEASNTNVETGEVAHTAEEAGTRGAAEPVRVVKGARGKWYVRRGQEKLAGPFDHEKEANAAMTSAGARGLTIA